MGICEDRRRDAVEQNYFWMAVRGRVLELYIWTGWMHGHAWPAAHSVDLIYYHHDLIYSIDLIYYYPDLIYYRQAVGHRLSD